MIPSTRIEHKSTSTRDALINSAVAGAKKGAWAGASLVLFADNQAIRVLDRPHGVETPPVPLYKLAPTVIITTALLGAVLNVFLSAVLKEQVFEDTLAHKD